jgi:dethiobiotin synthetase
LTQPLSPHAAAKIDGVQIDLSDFDLPDVGSEPLIVEGCGGVLVPINADHLVLDLILRFDLPTVVVARSGLGTINHTLLTLRELKVNRVNVLGVILNGEINKSNREAIEFYGHTPVIGEVEPLKNFSENELLRTFSRFASPADPDRNSSSKGSIEGDSSMSSESMQKHLVSSI